MEKIVISTDKAPAAIGPYSQAVRVGDLLFLSGQIPLDHLTGKITPGGIEDQARKVLDNIKGILESQKLGFKNLVKVTIFITDMNHFSAVNEIYASYFDQKIFPARSTVQVSGLPRGSGIEIEAIAHY